MYRNSFAFFSFVFEVGVEGVLLRVLFLNESMNEGGGDHITKTTKKVLKTTRTWCMMVGPRCQVVPYFYRAFWWFYQWHPPMD
jgi:hypothetical protein